MTNFKTTKRALVSSVLALVMCFSMLLGTTFAWFTDSVTSGGNIIQTGNLDIELEYYDGTEWKSVKDASDILKNGLWEPGYTDVAYLRLRNAGSLDLKYQLGVEITETEGINRAGDPFKLSDYIYFDVIEGVDGQTSAYATRDAALAAVTEVKLISAGYSKADKLAAGSDYLYLAMVVYMPTSVGNEACHNGTDIPKIDMTVSILATQLASESDSFDNQYDADAWVDGWKVYTAEDLQAAINNGESNITLMGDIAADETLVIPAATATYSLRSVAYALTIDLNGHTLSTVDKNVIRNDGTNVIIKNGTVSRTGTSGGYAINNVSGALAVDELTVVGGIYTAGSSLSVTDSDISQYLSSRHGIYAYNCETTINDSTIHNNNAGNATIMAAGSSVVTIDDSTVSIADGKSTQGWTSCMLDCNGTASFVLNSGTYNGGFRVNSAESSITINGGTYNDRYGSGYNINGGTVEIYGGTFTDKTSYDFAAKYVAEPYKAVANDDGTYTVYKNPVTNEDELLAVFAAGGEAMLVNDITLTDTVTVCNAVTLDLNGHTLTGAKGYMFKLLNANSAELYIKDTSEAQTGLITNENAAKDYSYAMINAVGNSTVLEISGGTIKNYSAMGGAVSVASTKTTISGGQIVNEYANSKAFFANSGEELVITGGEIINNASAGYAFFTNGASGAVISGGKFVNNGTLGYTVFVNGSASLTISGGEFINNYDSSTTVYAQSNAKLTISGGTITNNGASGSAVEVIGSSDGTPVATISGGTIINNGKTGIAVETGSNGTIYVTGGEIINNGTKGTAIKAGASWSGPSAIYVSGGSVSANGATLMQHGKYSSKDYVSTISVTGGIFDAEPSADYVADGYSATESNGVWTVAANN